MRSKKTHPQTNSNVDLFKKNTKNKQVPQHIYSISRNFLTS